jgi:hypothetical protein
MIIVAAGDSFVYGSELDDCFDGEGGPDPEWNKGNPEWPSSFLIRHSKKTFTSLLSDGHDYDCVAWPGYGNDSISRTVVERCEQLDKSNVFVIVSWTFPGRYEFRFNYDTKQRKSPWHTITPWIIETEENIKKEFINDDTKIEYQQAQTNKRAKTTGIADFAEVFYKHVGNSEYWEVYSSLKEIIYLQNYLKINNIRYMFSCADNSIIENYSIKNDNSTIKSLYKQIDFDKWFLFPSGIEEHQTRTPRGFYQWAVENKYPMGTTHPLESAHADAAKLMKEKFNELVKKSVQ